MDLPDDLVTATDAAKALGIPRNTVSQWAARGHIQPSGLTQHGRKLYRMRDVLRCERDRAVRSIGEARIT